MVYEQELFNFLQIPFGLPQADPNKEKCVCQLLFFTLDVSVAAKMEGYEMWKVHKSFF